MACTILTRTNTIRLDLYRSFVVQSVQTNPVAEIVAAVSAEVNQVWRRIAVEEKLPFEEDLEELRANYDTVAACITRPVERKL